MRFGNQMKFLGDRRVLVLLTAVTTFTIVQSINNFKSKRIDTERTKITENNKKKSARSLSAEVTAERASSFTRSQLQQNKDSISDKEKIEINSLADAVEVDVKVKKDVSFELAGLQAKKRQEAISKEYNQLFINKYGLSVEEGEALSQAVYEIEKSRIEAQYLLDNLEYQKNDFNELVRNNLSEEDYETYRSYEQNKKTEEYFADFDSFVNQDKYANLNTQDREELRQLVGEFQTGSTIDNSTGPYGNPPSVLGAIYEPNSPAQEFFINDQVSLLTGERDYLRQQASSDKQAEIIEGFYNEKINEVLSLSDEIEP